MKKKKHDDVDINTGDNINIVIIFNNKMKMSTYHI